MAVIQAGLLMNTNVIHFNDFLLKEKLSINPLILPPCGCWSFTQNIFRRPMPETSKLFQTANPPVL